MPVELADALVGTAAASFVAGVLAWMVVYGRLEGQGVEWGEWFFRGVAAIGMLASLAWAVFSSWSVHPLLVVLVPVPIVGAVLVTSNLTRRWKPPAPRRVRR